MVNNNGHYNLSTSILHAANKLTVWNIFMSTAINH
jgi:hypothetical protein